MAMNPLRIRHALRLATSALRHVHPTHTPTPLAVSARHLRPTPAVSYSSAPRSFNDMDKIDPDTVLFEGCDYKHWLIVMDFGKDPNQRPPPDQMVETYVQTCAQVIGSVEEAKKRIYACSTTTYTGFQVLVDEDVSKKFEGLPGVLFVLPDSYIDPVNKEYGGDKYNNGEIIPRPPPVQYGRTRRPAGQNEQRPRLPTPNQQGNVAYNHQQARPDYNQSGNPAYNQRGPAVGDGRGYTPQGPQQGFQQPNYPPKQNYGSSSPTPAYMGNAVPQGPPQGFQQQQAIPSQPNFPPKQNYGYQSGNVGNYNHGYNHPQGHINNRPGNVGGYAPPPGNVGGYAPPPGNVGGYAPPPGQFRSDMGNFGQNQPQGQGGYAPPGPGIGGYEQRRAGSFEQSGAGQGYSQNAGSRYPPQGGNQMYPPTSNEQTDPMQQRNYPPASRTGFN